jgi:glycosyltransferase involved in cell wall biosynthesis
VADSPEQFAEACILLLNNQDRREQLGDAARTYVREQYSWNTAVRNITNLYMQVLQRL